MTGVCQDCILIGCVRTGYHHGTTSVELPVYWVEIDVSMCNHIIELHSYLYESFSCQHLIIDRAK